MDELERLSLVSKVCIELENHFNVGDKDVAEFIIHLATEYPTFDKFKKAIHNEGLGDQFDDSLLANLLRLIQHMQPKKASSVKQITTIADEKELLRAQLPALAMPNVNTDILMEQLEGLMPKWKKEQVEKINATKMKEKSGKGGRHRSRSGSAGKKYPEGGKVDREKEERKRKRSKGGERRRRRSSSDDHSGRKQRRSPSELVPFNFDHFSA